MFRPLRPTHEIMQGQVVSQEDWLFSLAIVSERQMFLPVTRSLLEGKTDE